MREVANFVGNQLKGYNRSVITQLLHKFSKYLCWKEC